MLGVTKTRATVLGTLRTIALQLSEMKTSMEAFPLSSWPVSRSVGHFMVISGFGRALPTLVIANLGQNIWSWLKNQNEQDMESRSVLSTAP